MRYSIEDTTLTGIANALRRKHGETRLEDGEIVTKISKTPNATGFDSWEGDHQGLGETYDAVTIPGAESIHVKMAYQTFAKPNIYVQVAAGKLSEGSAFVSCENYGGQELTTVELTFEDTDTVTFRFKNVTGSTYCNYLGYYAEITGQSKVEVLNTYDPLDMADAIDSIKTGHIPTDEELTVAGVTQYRFSYNAWNWIIENYGDRITTKDLYTAIYMFKESDKLAEIPFELNFKANTKNTVTQLFYACKKIKSVPKMNNLQVDSIDGIFHSCESLREIPDDIDANWDWSIMDSLTSGYSGNRANTFNSCYSLRKFPMSFLNHGNPTAYYSYSIYSSCFNNCYVLDEIVGIPFPHTNATWTSNAFGGCFTGCSRAKNITFALQEDGTPYSANWKTQTIDLSARVGHGLKYQMLDYNSGITEDKYVTSAAEYQALKDDPDWFTASSDYSRYNHDSAVNTINSLPDTSAYLATAGGNNTIKFLGAAGSLTDGGAINTLTEEEIAVAAAKGWTVTFA